MLTHGGSRPLQTGPCPHSRPALPEAAAVRVVALRQQLPQRPVDGDQGDGELAGLVRVPLLPPERGLPLRTGPGARGLRGGLPTHGPRCGALCNKSKSRRVGAGCLRDGVHVDVPHGHRPC